MEWKMPRFRSPHREMIGFLSMCSRPNPGRQAVHVILDNPKQSKVRTRAAGLAVVAFFDRRAAYLGQTPHWDRGQPPQYAGLRPGRSRHDCSGSQAWPEPATCYCAASGRLDRLKPSVQEAVASIMIPVAITRGKSRMSSTTVTLRLHIPACRGLPETCHLF